MNLFLYIQYLLVIIQGIIIMWILFVVSGLYNFVSNVVGTDCLGNNDIME
jgi:hypothetical protein